MRNVLVLIFCNKQDLPNAAKPTDMSQALGLSRLPNEWYVQPCIATTGQGLYEGLDWLTKALTHRSSESPEKYGASKDSPWSGLFSFF